MALLNGALKVLNTGVGSTITQIVLFGGAIWGVVSKLTVAGGIIPSIVSQFKMLGTIMSGGLSAGIAAAGTGATAFTAIMGSSLPIILAVTAAIALFAAEFKAFKDAQYESSFEGIQSKIAETDDEIKSAEDTLKAYEANQDSLTEAEIEYAEALRNTIQELKNKKSAMEGSALEAAEKETRAAVTGARATGQEFYTEGGDVIRMTEAYNKEKEAYDALQKSYTSGKRLTVEMKEELQAYIKEYEPYINKMEKAGATQDQINEKFDGLADHVDTAKKQLAEWREATGDYSDAAVEDIDEVTSAIDDATTAFENFKAAMSEDLGAHFKELSSGFEGITKKIEEGTASMDEVKFAVSAYLPEGTWEELGYDLDKGLEALKAAQHGDLGTLLADEDVFVGIQKVIQSHGGQITDASGNVVAEITSDNEIIISSYEALAEALGTNVSVAESVGAAIQEATHEYFFTTEQVTQLADALKLFADNGDISTMSAEELTDAISQIEDTTDPFVIKAFVDALKELGLIDPDVEVDTSSIDEAKSKTEELKEEVEGLDKKKAKPEVDFETNKASVEQVWGEIDQISDAKPKVEVEVEANKESLDKTESDIKNAMGGGDAGFGGDGLFLDGIEGIGGESKFKATVDTEVNTDGLEEGQSQLEDFTAEAEEPADMTVTVNTDEVIEAQEQVQILQEMEDPQKKVYVDYSEALAGMAAWQAILNSPSETHKYEYIHIIQIVTTIHHAKGARSTPDETAMVNDGTPINGSSAEIIQQNGRMYIAGQGNLTTEHLERGARVYNAADTQAILRKNNLKEEDLYGEGIPAFAAGTTRAQIPSSSNLSVTGGYEGYVDDSPARWGHGEENVIDLPTPAIADKIFPNSKWSYATEPNSNIATFRDWIETVGFTEENLKDTMEQALQQGKDLLKSGDITEEEYFRGFYFMNEAAYKFRDKQAKTYQKYAQKIYDWEHGQIKELVELEEKLADLEEARAQRMTVYSGGKYGYTANIENIAKAQRDVDQALAKKWDAYANGTTGASGGMALVGEHGPELRVLGGGDGILPAQATRNLMRMANVGDFTGKAGGTTNIFNVDNVELPSVTNAQEFVDGLKNLAIQKAMAR